MSKEVKATAFNDWTDSDLTRLVLQAKHAYDTRQLKNCLTYTNLLLQADPENAEGRALLNAIRYEIDQDLNKARELLANPHLEDQPEVFGRGAEIIVKRILHLDPENQEARSLAGMLHIPPTTTKTLPVTPIVETFKVVSPTRTAKPAPKFGYSTRRLIPITAVVIVVIAITGVMALNRQPSATAPAQPAGRTTVAATTEPNFRPRLEPPVSSIIEPAAISNPKPAVEAERAPVTTPPRVAPPTTGSAPAPATPQVSQPPAAAVTRAATPARAVAAVPGTLAVSSRSPADIYEGGRYLGSTPTTLELSAGSHTLEYRHDDLRNTVTHVIKSGETTNAMIAFETAVQINAKPWANVSIQGADRRPLGQTPLSEVRVPVGGTLVFENPNFTTKYYRVTGKETAIQIVFP